MKLVSDRCQFIDLIQKISSYWEWDCLSGLFRILAFGIQKEVLDAGVYNEIDSIQY